MAQRRVLATVVVTMAAMAWGVGGAGAQSITGAAGQTPAEREVRAAEEQMHKAYASGDVALFTSLYAADGTFTYSRGATVTSQQRIKDFATQAKERRFTDLRDEIVSITVLGDVALVRCISRYSNPGGAPDSHLTILRVWHRRGGRWQVVAFQSTAVRAAGTTP
ncbi:MAG: nuclear transport factor 2 family protein [Vicinamibacterales bacterium]